MKRWKKWLYGSLSLIGIMVLYIVGMSGWIHYVAQTSHGSESDAIIVLGAAVWNGKPSNAMKERLDIALEAYNKGLAPRIITTGGTVTSEPSEASVMKKYLVANGVPASAIRTEEESTSTMENLRNSKHIMKQEKWQSAIIVTHGFHTYRSLLMARSLDMNVTAEPVRIKPIAIYYYTLRECAGIIYFAGEQILNRVRSIS
ncbi:YdcF family protein [Paenibacillus sp. FJAT-26967]|uniref:YdcF family protein n=1 Tax=Paenibacillus sp. FJAT-26967 TaxID=1729690 RepID=UPI000839821E|nr:YdcF family protein [Paenibacillus sp. FJAT-26967]